MSMELLNNNKLKEIIPGFKKFLSGEGQKYQSARADKKQFFEEYFSKDAIQNIDEGVLRELIKKLWAFSGWTNKDYLVNEMMRTELDEIKKGFKYLLHNEDDSLAKRFDYVKDNIRMMGPAGISEILCHFDEKYAIWNRRALEGLKWLGVKKSNLYMNNINGDQYVKHCKLCRNVLEKAKEETNEINDLLELDFLLFYISQFVKEEKEEETEDVFTADDFSHDEVIEQVAQLGDGLGFEVETEYNVAPGCRIDAIWRSRIANLGTISYAFEVHRRGSRDSAILNLQRVLRLEPSIQKVILVSHISEIEAFKNEISSLSEDFRSKVCYFQVEDLQDALDHLDLMKDILDEVGLMI